MGWMEASTAALIGAAVGAAVSLSSQFLGHQLALRQDRRNQRRERLTDAVIEAGAALRGPTRDERMSEEQFDEWKASLDPDSVAAQNPELHHDLRPFNDGVYRAMVTLELHVGQDHWLNEEYLNAIVKCAEAEEAKSRHFRSKNEEWRISDIPHLAGVAKEARQAQDHWMKLALDEIERI